MASEQESPFLYKHRKTKTQIAQQAYYLYNDNSLNKGTLLKEKQGIEMKQLFIKQTLLDKQASVRNNAISKRKMQETWDGIVQDKIAEYKANYAKENKAATVIQKYIRGHLLRMAVEQDFIDLIEIKCDKLIKESTAQALEIMLNLGVILVPATTAIQKAFRRYLIKKKISRLQKCYENYLYEKAEEAARMAKVSMRIIINYRILKELRFYQYRKRRLVQIKERLAILKIKEFWKSKKLSFRIIREKILRLKRRQAALLNKEAYTKYLNSLGGKLEKKPAHKLSIGSEDDKRSGSESPPRQIEDNMPGNTMDEEEFLEAQQIKELIQKKIQDKVEKGKRSYGINENKQIMVLPIMQEKALKESPSSDNRLMDVTSSVFAKGRSITREKGRVGRTTIISPPPNYEHKKMFEKVQAPHMRDLFTPQPDMPYINPPKNLDYAEFMAPTKSFTSKKYKIYSNASYKKKELKNLPVGSNLITSTITYSMKQQQKRTLNKKKHLSFSGEREKYIPSISNSSYSPIPWKPLPLNRNILMTTQYGKKFSKESDFYRYSIINFNKRALTPDLSRF
ncbi:hypothetical protein SteCoe_13762 [Stentor coeruleus]|uniref:Uncharacterized protein n=1 Tax=Stentor coeruleus TaxID=5963 RepID=A0A1R2C7V0_9CILI|nr:hypothetical protein SteCoe_13762 [Stentor coeruleus]